MLDHEPERAPSFRSRIASPALRSLYDYWLTRRGERPVMRRADLDPVDIPHLLKNLILAEVSDGGNRIRYRLVGTEIVTAHGLDYTGMAVEELTSGETLAFTRKLYGMVVTRAMPVYSEGRFRWAQREYRLTRRLHLPLSWDGSAVDLVLVGQIFESDQFGHQEVLTPAEPDEIAADYRASLERGV